MGSRKEIKRKVKAKAEALQFKRKKHGRPEFVDTWNPDWTVIGVSYQDLCDSIGAQHPDRRSYWAQRHYANRIFDGSDGGSNFPLFIIWNTRDRYAVSVSTKNVLLEVVRERRGRHWALYCFHSLVKRALKMSSEDKAALIADNSAGPNATHLPLHSIIDGIVNSHTGTCVSSDAIEAADLLVQRHFDDLCSKT